MNRDVCPGCGKHSWRMNGWHAKCQQRARTAEADTHRAWYARTGHCGQCGQPGDWCHCTGRAPCGCRDLHSMGSGVDRDPTDLYSDVTTDQGSLFE